MMKNTYILAILAVFAANSANAFDWQAHKDLAKKQAVEKMIDDKSVSTMVEEHKDLATGDIKETITDTVTEKTETTDTVDTITDTMDKVNTVKSWFN